MLFPRYILGLCMLLLVSCAPAVSRADVPAPRSFEAIALSTTLIRLYWLPAQGATGYQVTRDGAQVALLPAAATTYDDAGLAPDSTHAYTVTAQRGEERSAVRSYTERTFAPFPVSRSGAAGRTPTARFDVVVIQASSGGVAAAIEAARRGRRVALVEPTMRLGGMPVDGLCATDLRRPEHASGFFVRFRDAVRAIYAQEGVKTSGLQYEPRAAQQAMKALLYETPGITIFRLARLAAVHAAAVGSAAAAQPERSGGAAPDAPGAYGAYLAQRTTARRQRKRVVSVTIEELDRSGNPTGRRAELSAPIFIDATDSGDLAAWAGAPYRIGREARSGREPHAGVIYYDRAADKLLPGSTGKADRRLMSYAYLLVVKDYGPGADRTIPKPPGYRREEFLHSPAWKESWAVTSGRMPGSKYELNQHPEGNDLQEINYGYPDGSYSERRKVDEEYRDHVLGYLYYIQTEQGQRHLSLPDDEFRETGGIPPLLYVREGRRIEGEELPVETDITNAPAIVVPESLGIGDYPMDSHAVEPKRDWDRPDMGEGEYWLYRYTPVHDLPLGIIVPRLLDNVFVTTAVSSTHVSFGTYRLEPVRMAFGEAAGVAADLCLRYRLPVRRVPVRQVQEALLPHAANPYGDAHVYLHYLSDVPTDDPRGQATQYLTVRGFRVEADAFHPDAPTTRAELARWLSQLAARSAVPPAPAAAGAGGAVAPYAPYMGRPADRAAALKLAGQPDASAPATRAEVVRAFAAVLRPTNGGPVRPDVYADVTDRETAAAADMAAALGVDSRLWDSWNAYAPDGRLLLQPNMPLSHAGMFEALYVAQIGLGPLFFDNPVDGRNGWPAPPAPEVPAR